MRKPILAVSLVAACGLLARPGRADHEDLGAIDPSEEEQSGIYELNRARNDPTAYGQAIGIDLSGVPARPPLAVSRNLTGSARFHAQVMLDHHEYGHTSALLGIGPNQMAVDNGYDLFGNGLGASWGTTNTIESIMRSVNQVSTATGAVKALVIDKDVAGAGHRVHLLAIGAYGDYREIGFGWAAGTDSFPEFGLPKSLPTKLCAIHTAYSAAGATFLTGVVFKDANGNRRFDRGEGLGGVTVDAGGAGSAVTMDSGGWSLQAGPGTYLVRCSGGAFGGASAILATVGSENVEVDFHSGSAAGEVDFSWRDGVPAGPTVTATASPSSGTAPLEVDFSAAGLGSGVYSWDFANGDGTTGSSTDEVFGTGLFPVVLTGIDGTGAGRALALVSVADAGFPGEGLTAPGDGSLHIVKGLLKRNLKAAGKDQATLSGTLELPGGFSPAGQEVQACVGGAVRTFTLDAKGKGALPDGSKVLVKAKWPSDGSGVAAGVIAKVTVTLKGDLSAGLEAAGLRNVTETRTLSGSPVAVLLAGRPWVGEGTLVTKCVAGKSGKGTLTPE
jgi:hypothetical protein